MAKRGDLTKAQIIELLEACSANGAQLLEEARILYSKRHYPRSYVLAQLAGEECSKAHLLLSLLMLQVAGLVPPMESFWTWWVNHDDKSMFQESWNEVLSWTSVQNWLNLPPEAAQHAPERMDGLAASLATAKRRAPSRSSWREDATYVDFRDGKIFVPKGGIGRVRAQRKIADATAEVARVKDITDAQLGALIQMPEAVEFLRRLVAAIGERMAAMTESSDPRHER